MLRDRRVVWDQVEQVDARVARRAAAQWTIVDVHDLRACGLSDDAILTRVRTGRLYHEGLHTHRSDNVERAYLKGIPVTPPARTLIDLSSSGPEEQLRRALNEALNQRRIAAADLVTSHHRGAKKLRAILANAAPTRNENEDVVLAVLTRAGLPRPEVNQPYLGYVPDFRWPDKRVILEADSRRFHDHLLARADDKARQAVLEAHGETVLRTTWRQIVTRPHVVVRRVREALGPE